MSDQPIHLNNGTQWIRADFHLHTKADKEFKYTGDENFYINNYVEGLLKANIQLGVITNHNKFDYKEFKELRKAARKKSIELLAGVELSVNDGSNGIHTLLVFSDAWFENGNDYINPFLTSAFEGKIPSQYEQENGRSSLNLLETIKKLEGYHRDFFIVFAHVEAPSGLWNEMNGGRIEELGKNEFFRRRILGFQKVRTHDGEGKDTPCRTKVQYWLKDYYPAELEGSDPKNIEDIGKGKACYLKLGELSFESVKFSLSTPNSKVTKEIPKHNASFIKSIYFEGGILDKQKIHFSSELNTLIGIRGSGKSSILEAIRYVLDIPRGDKSQDTKYKDDLVQHTLGSGGKITLTACDVYGQEFTISRIFRESANVYLGGQLQPGVSIRETILRNPIYFGQKDLSSTGDGFETDLVEKLVGEKLKPLREKIQSQRERVREAAARWRKLDLVEEQKREYDAQLADAQFRLKKFEEYGIADKLQKRLNFQQDSMVLNRNHDKVKNFIDSINNLMADHEDNLRNVTSYITKENKNFFEEYLIEFSKIIEQLEKLKKIKEDTQSIANVLIAKQEHFQYVFNGLQEEFAQIGRTLANELKQIGGITIQPEDFIQQQQRRTKAEQMLEVLNKQVLQKQSIYHKLLEEVNQLNELWQQEFQMIQTELEKINDSQKSLQIQSEFKDNKEALVTYMQTMFRGSNIRESTLRNVMADYTDFGALLKDLQSAKTKMGSMPDIFENTFLTHLVDLVSWQVPNNFIIRYRNKELKHHSLGQRASALLLFVLSQKQNDVVIIDQPEDDLDNQTIYDSVIKIIKEVKPSTQFIFATHNANFPVLGDAEQVHACEYHGETIHLRSGGIDAQSVQESIIKIMEGGREAFNRRKEVYNLWKS